MGRSGVHSRGCHCASCAHYICLAYVGCYISYPSISSCPQLSSTTSISSCINYCKAQDESYSYALAHYDSKLYCVCFYESQLSSLTETVNSCNITCDPSGSYSCGGKIAASSVSAATCTQYKYPGSDEGYRAYSVYNITQGIFHYCKSLCL